MVRFCPSAPLNFATATQKRFGGVSEQPDLGGTGIEHLVALKIIAGAEQERQQKFGFRQPLFRLWVGARMAQLLQTRIHFGTDVPQLLRQLGSGDRLQQIADDIIADRLLRIAEIIVPAEENDLRRGADLAHPARQLNAGHQGHPNIGDEQIRLVLLDRLQRFHAIFGVCHDGKAEPRPVDPLQDRLPQFDLIVRKYDCVHTMPSVFLVTTYYYIGKPPSFQHKKIRR